MPAPSRHRLRVRESVVGVGLAAMLVALIAAPAAAQPRIVSPTQARVVGAKAVTVKVRGDFVRALVNSSDVTKRFGEPRGGVRRGRLVRGRDFRVGLNRIVLASGRGAARRYVTRIFLAARPAKLLTLRRVRGYPGRLSPIEFAGRSSAPLGRLRVAVNGHRIAVHGLVDADRRSFRLRLGADDGIRFGSNKLVVQGVTASGKRFSRLTKRLRVPRTGPLPGAGRDRRATVGRSMLLDASSTKRSIGGSRMRYRWRILSAPAGSEARLRRAGTRRPRIVPDRPGRYVLQLISVERRGSESSRGTLARTSAQAARTSDVMTVQATPSGSPLGSPVETLSPAGVRVGGASYPAAGSWVQVVVLDRSTLQMKTNVTIDAEPTGSVGVNSVTELEEAVDSASGADLVIISGGGRAVSLTEQAWEDISVPLASIGVSSDPLRESGIAADAFAAGQWSAIGVPGTALGSGASNLIGARTGGIGNEVAPGAPGSLQGYLQFSLPPVEPADSEAGGGYTFVSADHLHIDTQAAPAGEAVSSIEVGSATYTTAKQEAGTAGFHLLVLDDRLGEASQAYYRTNEAGGTVNKAGVEGLVNSLNAIAAGVDAGTVGPGLLVLQSFGSPAGVDPNWVHDIGILAYPWGLGTTAAASPLVGNEPNDWASAESGPSIASTVGLLAGPAAHDQVAQMAGTGAAAGTPPYAGGYTLIAPLGEPEAAISQSQVGSSVATAQLVGTLTRTRSSSWQLRNPSAFDEFDGAEVMDVAYQAPTGWPQSGTEALRKASAYIAAQLDLRNVTDVREAYYADDTAAWTALRDELEEVPYEAGKGFGKAEFEALRNQLRIEFPAVASVRNAVERWQEAFGAANGSSQVDLQYVANQVEREIEQAIASRRTTLEGELIAANVLDIAAGVAGTAGLGPAAGALGAVSSSILLANEFSQEKGGSLSATPVRAEAAKLGVELSTRYQQIQHNLSRVGEMLVSDWGKLKAAAQRTNSEWLLNSEEQEELTRALTISADREIYKAMLPLAYGEYLLAPGETSKNSPPRNEPWTYRCEDNSVNGGHTEPFANTQTNPGAWIAFPYELAGTPEQGFKPALQPRVLAIQGDMKSEEGTPVVVVDEPEVLPAKIAGKLFGKLDEGGYGLDQVEFFADPALQRWPLFC